MKLKAGHMVAERYEIDDIIGTGGMSVVYRAHDKKLDRYVTLKILKEEYLTDESLLERFPKEARAAAALNHQNITAIHDHGRDGDILYIVLEYVDGASLKEMIVKKAPFDDETNLGVAIQVAEGLAEAHANNIIHLDIKPQNILIASNSIVKVADFGIARAAKSVTLNAAAGSMGSVHYFSPEQARGGYIDHKSDIYSLGIVMFEMATGKLPFNGENEVAVALQHINDPLPNIQELNPHVSDSVVKIIQKATEKSASKRYFSIDDMLEDLRRALTDASGAFVDVESHDSSPTRTITEENKEAVRRQKMRKAFLDGVDYEEPEEPKKDGGFLIRDSAEVPYYQEGQEYGDYEEYENDFYEEPPPPQTDKKADRVAIFGGIFLGTIFTVGIIFLAWHLYSNVFSSTAGMIETPDVVGLSWQEASAQLQMLGLDPVRDDDYCTEADCEDDCVGQVIYQRTYPGFMLSRNDPITLVVSLGKEGASVMMPRLTERTLDDAREILYALDIQVTIQIRDYEDDEMEIRNVVMRQIPEANDRLVEGDIVILYVSVGMDDGMISVPMLIGLTESDALNIIQGDFIADSRRESSETFPEGSIIRQEPSPDTEVSRNTRITYWVSTGRETPLSTPDPSPEPTDEPDATPEPTDEPAPTEPPAETPEPTETPPVNIDENPGTHPTPPAPQIISGMLTIHLGWQVPEGAEIVHLVVQRQMGNAEAEVIYENANFPISQFPFNLPIEYTDPTVFRVFSVEDGVYVSRGIENRP